MSKSGVNVFAGGVHAGHMGRSDRDEDTFLFTYRNGCPAQAAVSLTMPVRADQYDAMSGLLPIFDMNLPEGALRERLRLQFAKAIPEFDDLDLLAVVGSSQIGRLRYSREERLAEDVPTEDLKEILTYQGSADLFAHLLQRFATHSGISGVQPKVLVRASKVPDKVTHRGATHIVKAFDAAEFPELAANEMICLHGAAKAGIETSNVRLSDNRRLLVVDRFDLAPQGAYLGIEDFCVLDGRRAHGRYDGSYERIATRITDFVSPGALLKAREQFALMVAYACATENGDAHLKNFSVLYGNPLQDVAFAPAYDLISTTPYISRDTLALTLEGSKSFPDQVRLLKFIRQVTGKSERSARELLQQVAVGVNGAIGKARAYASRHKDAKAFADRLIAAFTRGLARLALQPVRRRGVPVRT